MDESGLSHMVCTSAPCGAETGSATTAYPTRRAHRASACRLEAGLNPYKRPARTPDKPLGHSPPRRTLCMSERCGCRMNGATFFRLRMLRNASWRGARVLVDKAAGNGVVGALIRKSCGLYPLPFPDGIPVRRDPDARRNNIGRVLSVRRTDASCAL